MSETYELHVPMAAKGGIKALITLAAIGNEVSRQYCSGAICNFSKTKECRDLLVDGGKETVARPKTL